MTGSGHAFHGIGSLGFTRPSVTNGSPATNRRAATPGALSTHEIDHNRSGESGDGQVAAALRFGLTVNAKRGGVSDDDLAEVRAAGYDDADIAAIVAHVALNVLTNYFNRVAQPVIDFPEMTPRMAEAA